MPDPSGGPDPGPAKCRNGHPVAAADRVWHKGQMRCPTCLREARRRWRETRLAKPATYAYCGRCGAAKYEDARTYCGPCRHATRGEVAKVGGAVERATEDAVMLETAPHWVRADPREHARWIAAERAERRRRGTLGA